jgi:hypothetical protein
MKIPGHWLEDLLFNIGADPEEAIRKDYSGRGMMRGVCLGLTFENDAKWEEFIVELAIYRQIEHEDDINPSPRDQVKEVVSRARKDSMGMGIIVYWPYGGLEIGD